MASFERMLKSILTTPTFLLGWVLLAVLSVSVLVHWDVINGMQDPKMEMRQHQGHPNHEQQRI